jgi:hypothetical protein
MPGVQRQPKGRILLISIDRAGASGNGLPVRHPHRSGAWLVVHQAFQEFSGMAHGACVLPRRSPRFVAPVAASAEEALRFAARLCAPAHMRLGRPSRG